MIIALDIETIPNADMISRLPEPEVALGNMVDPAKIAAKKEAAKSKQVADMALDPLYGRVCCVCMAGEKEITIMPESATDENERSVLQQVMEIIADPETRLATWNGNGFDLPFLYRRAMILGVSPSAIGAPPLSLWTKKYNNDRHIDLMRVWAGDNSQSFAKLDSVASAILGVGKTEHDFAEFPALMQTPEGRAKIGAYCLNDTRLTFQLYQKAQGCLFA
jgi:predicted PolB exonuclease-like 3'-5' exonuclease